MMKDMKRTNKVLVVTNRAGEIQAALWPGEAAEGAPTQVGVTLRDDQTAHEVELPKELYQSTPPNFGDFQLSRDASGTPVLMKRSAK